MSMDFDVRGQQNALMMFFFLFFYKHFSLYKMLIYKLYSRVDYLWIIVMFLSAVWILILTAPIHSRGSIGEQVM